MKGITPRQALRGGSEFAGKLLSSSDLKSPEFQGFVEDPAKMNAGMEAAVEAFVSAMRSLSLAEGPNLNSDGSVTIRLEVDGDKTDEQCVAEAKEVGWWVNGNIRSDRRVKVRGQSKPKGVYEATVTLKKIVPSGSVWKKDKVTSVLGKPGLDMDLRVLVALIPFRDELRKLGVNWIYGWGSRFRASDGDECVAYLDLENRSVHLSWFEDGWNAHVWFGSVGK